MNYYNIVLNVSTVRIQRKELPENRAKALLSSRVFLNMCWA